MRLRLLWLLVAVSACKPERAPVSFALSAPRTIDVDTRRQLELDLSVGVGDEREGDRLVESTHTRARVSRRDGAAEVSWLEHPRWSGRNVVVTDAPSSELELASQALVSSLAMPSPLQVALISAPVPWRDRLPTLERHVAAQIRDGVGSRGSVRDVVMRLEAATDAVAVFSLSLVLETQLPALTLEAQLAGTLEISRAESLPLSLALEGPVGVRPVATDDETPTVQGAGSLVLQRRLVLVDETPVLTAEAR